MHSNVQYRKHNVVHGKFGSALRNRGTENGLEYISQPSQHHPPSASYQGWVLRNCHPTGSRRAGLPWCFYRSCHRIAAPGDDVGEGRRRRFSCRMDRAAPPASRTCAGCASAVRGTGLSTPRPLVRRRNTARSALSSAQLATGGRATTRIVAYRAMLTHAPLQPWPST